MTEDLIKHMVQRFLGWKLPANFSPDAGISFKAEYNEHTAYPAKHEPTGTNLFDAGQATEMVRHMVEGCDWAAWLIEWPADANVPPRWWNPSTGWMRDALKATHFVRREDAESVLSQMRIGEPLVVTEHMFVGPTSA